jgi:ribosomal protein S18 acetylase RimI-like enzyme
MILTFQEVRSAYKSAFPESPFLDTWIPEEKFLSAEIDNTGNFLISREDDGIYGIALGPSPAIPTNWKNFSMESQGISTLPDAFKVVAEWDCYWAPTVKGVAIAQPISSDSEISEFLTSHAPDSSVFPGNDEILQWIEIRSHDQLVAIAALCRWQSGHIVISSVATHADYRGKGLGKALMQKCLIAGSTYGESYLCLGVRHENESAQKLYEGSGFRLMHNFSYCERR